jgi:hypothetical protein
MDESGTEVAYSLSLQDDHVKTEAHSVYLRENSFAPGQYTQIVLEVGKQASFHNAVHVQTPESDFIDWVEVAASDDAHLWRIVNPRAPISRFRRENLAGNQTVRYSQNNARYLRLRIFEPSRQFPVTSASISFNSELAEPSRDLLPALLAVDPSAPASLSRWNADLGSALFPIAEVAFETSQPAFYRAVRLLTSEDGQEWTFRAGGEIYRYKVGDKLEESLRVRLDESWGPRYWRVEVVNENDSALTAVSAKFAMISRTVVFEQRPDHSYRLLYGNENARTPHYDLEHLVSVEAQTKSVVLRAAFGPEELTSNYFDPRPFTERHPALLGLALGIAVILLGYAALRALRTPNSAPRAE